MLAYCQLNSWEQISVKFESELHQPRLWFITGGYLVKRWYLPAAARARGQSNDLNREILASNLFNCRKEVINDPPVPSISRCIHIVYRHKNVWEYQWSNFIYNCLSIFLHYLRCKDAPLDCSAPGGEKCESLTRVDEILSSPFRKMHLELSSAKMAAILYIGRWVNTLRPRQNGRHFTDDIFLNENIWISIKISLKFVPKGPINNIPALVQIMAWRRPGDKPLSEPMMV